MSSPATARTQPDQDSWDAMWTVIESLVAGHPANEQVEAELAVLCAKAMTDGYIDRELRAEATARWLLAIVASYHELTTAHSSLESDSELATMYMIITRYLKPPRPGL